MKIVFKLLFFICIFLNQALCIEKSHLYNGKLIDATTQWPIKLYTLSKLEQIVSKSQISKAGIYLNSLNPSTKDVLLISKELDSSKIFFKGSPKYFHFEKSLNNKKIDELINEIKINKYKFVSEIMYRHADKKEGMITPFAERAINPMSKESVYLIKKINDTFPNLPILIHWEFYKWKEDYPLFSNLFNTFPKQIFIINHMGFGDTTQVESLLKNHKNIFFTISKRNRMFKYFKDSSVPQGLPLINNKDKLEDSWKKILIRYDDRFLFATDSHKNYMWNNYQAIVQDYRKILFMLPTATADKIAHKNAEKLFNLKD
jgi:hypothetical protein